MDDAVEQQEGRLPGLSLDGLQPTYLRGSAGWLAYVYQAYRERVPDLSI